MAKLTKSQQIGATVEHLVAKLISEMGHIWRPNTSDFGIDGQVEVADRNSNATGTTISVQVKSTSAARMPGETHSRFTYTCGAKDLDYWMGASEPVLLIVVRLDQERAWWKRLDTWFADPHRRKARVVEFDKVDDLLGRGSVHQIAAAATPIDDPLPLVRSSETLTTNLLAVESFAPLVHWASADVTDRQEAWAAMKDHGLFESGFILRGGNVFSLLPLTGALAPLRKGIAQSFPVAEWKESEDMEIKRWFVSLLNFTLRSMHYQELRLHPDGHYLFHVPSRDLSPRKVKVGKGTGRTIFEVYKDKENKVGSCRHYAAHLNFRQWDGQWFLEINPTYHFTRDGERESLFASEQLSTIKRMERNAAVRGLVTHWAQYLVRSQADDLFGSGDQRVVFGQLATLTVDASIDERSWIVPREVATADVPLLIDDELTAS